jgi:hypothetical protein
LGMIQQADHPFNTGGLHEVCPLINDRSVHAAGGVAWATGTKDKSLVGASGTEVEWVW